MKRFLTCALLVAALGCGDSPTEPGPRAPADPVIKVRNNYGVGVGPVGAGRVREYEGPASQAPAWAQPSKSK
jgi:hypothetical protein